MTHDLDGKLHDRPKARRGQQTVDLATFKAEHPRCCFCHGQRETAERDHAPARICFRRKQAPEGLEYPACGPCNRAAAHSEQVAALWIRCGDQSGDYFDAEDLDRLITGVANNTPQSLPIISLSETEKHRRLSRYGIADQVRRIEGALPVAGVPKAVNRHLELFATKVLYATYYRVAGQIAGPRLRRIVDWAQVGSPAAGRIEQNAANWFGDPRVGQRRNIDLGEQYVYREAYHPNHGVLGLQMRFGTSFVFFCVIGPGRDLAKTGKPIPKRYCPIRELGLTVGRRRA